MVHEELDYEREGHNAERFADAMRGEQDVIVPAVLWQQTTHRVLTLEWVRGYKMTQIDRARRRRYQPRRTGTPHRQPLFQADP